MSRRAAAKRAYDPEVEHERQARGDAEGRTLDLVFSSETTIFVRHGLGRKPRGMDQVRVPFSDALTLMTDAFVVSVGLDPAVYAAVTATSAVTGTATARFY